MLAAIVAEPRSGYLALPRLVVDCSLLAATLFDEPERNIALDRIAGHELHAPTLLDFEMASVALKKARAGLGETATCGLADFHLLALQRHAVDTPALLQLALRYELTAYDAAYLWLAAELRAPLVTFDRRLGDAARLHFGTLS